MGCLFRGRAEGRIRKTLIEENLLEAVIGLPANLFFGTGIPAAIPAVQQEIEQLEGELVAVRKEMGI